jgi:hypothetical protein
VHRSQKNADDRDRKEEDLPSDKDVLVLAYITGLERDKNQPAQTGSEAQAPQPRISWTMVEE